MTATMEDVVRGQQEAWAAYKVQNEKSEKELKEHGTILAATQEMLEKLNKRLDESEVKMKRAWAAVEKDGTILTEEQVERKKVFDFYLRIGETRLTPEQFKTLLVSDDTGGGFLTLPEMASEIDKDIIEISPIRELARVTPIGGKSLLVPRRTGVFTAEWEAEGVTQTETEGLAYGQEEMHAHPLRALVQISLENLEDPLFDLEAEIRMEAAEQFAVGEGLAFVTGTGVGRPQGYTQTALNGVTLAQTAASGTLDADDIIDLSFSVKSGYSKNATWVMHRLIIAAVRKLKDSDNQYLWQPGLNGPTQSTILGRPLIEVPDMASTLTANDIIIGYADFRRLYRIADRITMSILRDPFTLAHRGLVRFVMRKRVGGQVVRAEAGQLLEIKP